MNALAGISWLFPEDVSIRVTKPPLASFGDVDRLVIDYPSQLAPMLAGELRALAYAIERGPRHAQNTNRGSTE